MDYFLLAAVALKRLMTMLTESVAAILVLAVRLKKGLPKSLLNKSSFSENLLKTHARKGMGFLRLFVLGQFVCR